ncbi:hypothetical protein GCM10022198_13840 [Klugiella xanthotipulae]|uniref:Regulatory LuxR family protein n=1 Tax=Klugiella xanthotipulae TaxID=244735 RepID=A0A543I4J5_9MICO|nr:regulatory LuxR family protein [Klugiella xanthotipulae]
MIARMPLIQHIVELLTGHTSVSLTGSRWSGRTTVLTAVIDIMRRDHIPVTVHGIGRALPLEAVRLALPTQVRKALGPACTASDVIEALIDMFTTRPGVFFIDDADELDDVSWAVISALHRTRGTAILATSFRRADEHHADDLMQLAHPVVNISLGELSLESTHELLEDRAQNLISPVVTGQIHTLAAGVPGFAVALLDAAMGSGVVFTEGSMLVAEGDIWSPAMNGAYETLLQRYPINLQEALEMLSLAGTVTLPTARAFVTQPVLEALHENALIKVAVKGDRTIVSVTPPGIRDYFRHQPPTPRRDRLTESMFSALAATTPEEVAALNSRFQARVSGGPGLETPASSLDAHMFAEDYTIHLATCRFTWGNAPTVANAIEYLYTQLTGNNDPEVVEMVLRDTDWTLGYTPLEEFDFRYLHARWLTSQGAAEAEVRAALRAEDDYAYQDALDTIMYMLGIEAHGLPDTFVEDLTEISTRPDFNGTVASGVLAAAYILSGRAREAVPMLDRMDDTGQLWRNYQVSVLRGLALAGVGEYAEAARFARRKVDEAVASSDRLALVGNAYVGALSLCLLGQFEEAYTLAGRVVGMGIVSIPVAFAVDKALLICQSVSALRTGRMSSFDSLREFACQAIGDSESVPFGTLDWADAASTLTDKDRDAAAHKFRAVAEEARASGYDFAADIAVLLSLLSHYDPEVAEAFAPAAERVGGALFPALLAARQASQFSDPDGIYQAAEALQMAGATSEAIRYFALSARYYRERRDVDGVHRARLAIRTVTAPGGGSTSEVDTLAQSSVVFTPRETEIVDLVARGLSNSEIAAALVVSTRTVESHINNIRRKTAAIDRDDIVAFARVRGAS